MITKKDGRLERPFLGLLPTEAAIALGAGAAGSVGFVLYAGQRVGAPRLLLGLFAMWVISPFVVLAVGYVASKRWSVLTRATLYRVTPVVIVASLVIYGAVAFGAPRPRTAVFVIVAPASWLLMAIVVATAAFISRQSSFRRKLPRVYELRDMLTDPSNPDAYFQNFGDGLEQNASKLNAFVKLEGWLAALDDEAWNDLKERAAVHLVSKTRNTGRGWQALFDVFSEARGFGYLRSIDCTAVHFIKRTEGKTPDLGAVLDGGQVLCEVKTINISQDEAERRQRITQGAIIASSTSVHVGEGYLRKLSSTLEHAVEQLDGLDPERKARRLVFVVVLFDDWVGDYQPEYFAQIDEHLLRSPIEGAELVFCPASNLFERTFTMRSATVLAE